MSPVGLVLLLMGAVFSAAPGAAHANPADGTLALMAIQQAPPKTDAGDNVVVEDEFSPSSAVSAGYQSGCTYCCFTPLALLAVFTNVAPGIGQGLFVLGHFSLPIVAGLASWTVAQLSAKWRVPLVPLLAVSVLPPYAAWVANIAVGAVAQVITVILLLGYVGAISLAFTQIQHNPNAGLVALVAAAGVVGVVAFVLEVGAGVFIVVNTVMGYAVAAVLNGLVTMLLGRPRVKGESSINLDLFKVPDPVVEAVTPRTEPQPPSQPEPAPPVAPAPEPAPPGPEPTPPPVEAPAVDPVLLN